MPEKPTKHEQQPATTGVEIAGVHYHEVTISLPLHQDDSTDAERVHYAGLALLLGQAITLGAFRAVQEQYEGKGVLYVQTSQTKQDEQTHFDVEVDRHELIIVDSAGVNLPLLYHRKEPGYAGVAAYYGVIYNADLGTKDDLLVTLGQPLAYTLNNRFSPFVDPNTRTLEYSQGNVENALFIFPQRLDTKDVGTKRDVSVSRYVYHSPVLMNRM